MTTWVFNPFTSELDATGSGGGGTGTVTSFSFTDANGFDGTVTNPTTTPNLTLTTTVTDDQVMISNSGAISGDADLTFVTAANTLNVGASTTSSNGNIVVGGSSTGIGTITGGGSQFNLVGGAVTLESSATNYVRIVTDTVERLRVDDDGAWLLASDPGTATYSLKSNGAGVPPTWQADSAVNVWVDQGSSTTIAANTNYFASAAVTLTLPAAPAQGNTIEIIVDTASTVVVQANTGQTIRIGQSVSSSAGSATSVDRGNGLKLVYRAATTSWIQQNAPQGTWNLV